jgi:hypothetical protein
MNEQQLKWIWFAVRYLAERTVENHENLRQDSRQRCRELNLVPFEHKANRDFQ